MNDEIVTKKPAVWWVCVGIKIGTMYLEGYIVP